MVDGNVWVQCMMGDVVHGWHAVWVSGNQIHDTSIHYIYIYTQTVTAEGELSYRSGCVRNHLHGDHPGKVILKYKCVTEMQKIKTIPHLSLVGQTDSLAPTHWDEWLGIRLITITCTVIHYPKWLTIGEYIKRFILRRHKHTGTAHNTKFQALFK